MKPLQVITVAYNRPDFIGLQYHSLCKYLIGSWVFKVFSDAEVNNQDNDHKIKAVCKKLHVQHIRVPPYIQTLPGPSPRAGNALDWALKNYAYSYDGLTLVMDSDMFLVKSFNPVTFMTYPESPGLLYDMAGVVQTMSHSGYWFRYLWMALMLINGKSIKHKNPDQIRFMNAVPVESLPTDAGGPMHYYLENHPELEIKPLKHMWSGTWTIPEIIDLGFSLEEPFCQYMKKEKDDPEIAGIGEMISHYFYHYRAGSNWNQLSPEVVNRRAQHLQEYMSLVKVVRNPEKGPFSLLQGLVQDHSISSLKNWNIPWHFYVNTEVANSEIERFVELGISKGYNKDQLTIYMEYIYDTWEPQLRFFLNPNNYVLPPLDKLEELFLIHETLHDEKAILSLDDYSMDRKGYDSDLTHFIVRDRPKNYLRYTRPGMDEETEREEKGTEGEAKGTEGDSWEFAKKIYAIDPQLLDDILGIKRDSRPQITTNLTCFPIRKQHHYQIIIIGKKLDPNVSIQLVCVGDTFFGALNAKEFSLTTEMTLIKWDFYNKFETKIDIGLEVRDDRVLKNTDLSSTYEIRRAYLSCIGPLG